MREIDKENNMSSRKLDQQRKQSYRELLNRVDNLEESEDLGINTMQQLHQIFQCVNFLDSDCNVEQRVEQADETILDSVVLGAASSMLLKCIESVDICKSTYEPAEFAIKILNLLKGDNAEECSSEDWLKLLDDARDMIPEVPKFSFMFGAFDATKLPQPKEKVQHQKAVTEKVEKKQLLAVQNTEKEEEGVEETVNVLQKVLAQEYENNGNKPINYYEYVIDKDSFENTIENMFYCSFLIRDGRAQLEVNDAGVPLIKPVKKKALKAFRDSKGANTQMINSLNIEEWRQMPIEEGLVQRYKKLINSY